MPENTAKTATEWVFVAKSVAQMPDGQGHALRCMAWAGMAAQDLSDWLTLAKTWQQEFNDPYIAHQCMTEAEEVSEGTDDWIQIAKTWGEHLQDLDNTIRCMEKAEKVADYLEDYSAIEETYRTHFPNLDSAIRRAAILRVVDTADDEGRFDCIYFRETWGSERVSERRHGSYAKYYRVTLPRTTDIAIDLISNVDTYLYLISGNNFAGEVLDENDDRPDDDSEGLSSTDSRIRRQLSAGIYSIEATTFDEEETGAFILNIYYRLR